MTTDYCNAVQARPSVHCTCTHILRIPRSVDGFSCSHDTGCVCLGNVTAVAATVTLLDVFALSQTALATFGAPSWPTTCAAAHPSIVSVSAAESAASTLLEPASTTPSCPTARPEPIFTSARSSTALIQAVLHL